jgi:nucleoside-diphosphate-sugar epimerase
MRILITGANGFIGSNLARYLVNRGYTVYALVRPTSDITTLDPVCDKIEILKVTNSFLSIEGAVRKANPDVIVHLAALSVLNHNSFQVEELVKSNILFPTFLVEAMVRNKKFNLINTSTFWECLKRQGEYNPCNLYAATKFSFEQILRYYEDAHNLKTITLKLYGTYGPYDRRHKIFFYLKNSLNSKTPILFSPGRQKLDLVYIDDIVRVYEKAIRYISNKFKDNAETFMIGTGNALELRKIAQIYEECSKGKLNIKWGGLPYRDREIMVCRANIKKAKERLKWQPHFDLRKGIQKLLREESAR